MSVPEVSVLTPISSISPGKDPVTYQKLSEKLSKLIGVEESAVQVYQLTPCTDSKQMISGPVACFIKTSDITLESVEILLEENEQLKTNIARTAASLAMLQKEVERVGPSKPVVFSEDNKSKESMEKEIENLKVQLRQSLAVREESQQMLDILKKEFHTLTQTLINERKQNAEHHNVTQVDTALCPYQLRVETQQLTDSESPVYLKLLGNDNLSDDIQLPFHTARPTTLTNGEYAYEFDCDAIHFKDILELWMWREDGDVNFPISIRSIKIEMMLNTSGKHKPKRWKFKHARSQSDKAQSSKYVRFLPASVLDTLLK